MAGADSCGLDGTPLQLLIDFFLSVPWLFLLITVRAVVLPLNISPQASVTVTFALLGLLGWPRRPRATSSGAKDLMNSEFVWMARASGFSGMKLIRLHLLPNLRDALFAQFWISIPVFIIAEANLGALGLGYPNRCPRWGSLLHELQDADHVTSGTLAFASSCSTYSGHQFLPEVR